MNKVAVIIGLLVLALSLQGKNRADLVTVNYGLNINGYSNENMAQLAQKDITVVERVQFSPTAELKISQK